LTVSVNIISTNRQIAHTSQRCNSDNKYMKFLALRHFSGEYEACGLTVSWLFYRENL